MESIVRSMQTKLNEISNLQIPLSIIHALLNIHTNDNSLIQLYPYKLFLLTNVQT